MPTCLKVFAIALGCLLATLAQGQVYRCADGGKVVYSDKPCPDGVKVPIAPRADQAPAERPQAEANMGRVIVGQTPLQVEQAWGKPQRKNIDTRSSGRTEQWVYERADGTVYVYFREGVVSSYSQSVDTNKPASAPPLAQLPSHVETTNEERVRKADQRRFIHDGQSKAQVAAQIGKPDATDYSVSRGECWQYYPAGTDSIATTTVCFADGNVYDVRRGR